MDDPYDVPTLYREVLTAIASGVMTDAAIVAARGLVEAGHDNEWVHAIAGAQDMDAVEWAWELLLEETTMSEWISVDDELPEEYEYVLFLRKLPSEYKNRYPSVMVGYRMRDKWVRSGFDYSGEVTHWMPLPEAPE